MNIFFWFSIVLQSFLKARRRTWIVTLRLHNSLHLLIIFEYNWIHYQSDDPWLTLQLFDIDQYIYTSITFSHYAPRAENALVIIENAPDAEGHHPKAEAPIIIIMLVCVISNLALWKAFFDFVLSSSFKCWNYFKQIYLNSLWPGLNTTNMFPKTFTRFFPFRC